MPQTNQPPFNISIFLPNGNPEGLRIIKMSNWTGRGVVCPRPILSQALKERDEFNRTGVYVLIGPGEEGKLPEIYIGEAEKVGERVKKQDLDKDFWQQVIFFVKSENLLNKAEVKYLESRLWEMAREAKRSKVANGNPPQKPSLSEEEKADADSFLVDMLKIFPLLNLDVFQKAEKRGGSDDQLLLYIDSKGVKATGWETEAGFVVEEGSQCVKSLSEKSSGCNFRCIFAVSATEPKIVLNEVTTSPAAISEPESPTAKGLENFASEDFSDKL